MEKAFRDAVPLKYNDGQPIEDEKVYQTREGLIARFDAISFMPWTVQGIWVHDGTRYEDELLRIAIDIDYTPENNAFLVAFKTTLCERFQQIEIYIASNPVGPNAIVPSNSSAGAAVWDRLNWSTLWRRRPWAELS